MKSRLQALILLQGRAAVRHGFGARMHGPGPGSPG